LLSTFLLRIRWQISTMRPLRVGARSPEPRWYHRAVIACYGKDLTSGRVNGSQQYVVMPSFSTIKVLLAATFWRAVAAGELREERSYAFQPWQAVGGAGVLRGFRHAARLTLADYLHLALVVSDNDATNVVLAFVGYERVAALAAELGLSDTALRRQMMDWDAAAAGRDNLTCARDLVTLFELLARRDPRIGAQACERVLSALSLQEHRDGLPRGLPGDATYAGKPGDDQPEGRFCHDCGLVTSPAGETLVLAVMTDGEGGYDAVAATGRRLYDELSGNAAGKE
jgi:beta-lactamase class A